MAPEIYTGEKYNFKCDVWSLGIVLYQLLYGETPWNSEKNQKDLFENNILKKPLEFNQDTEIKESTKELIRGMLELKQDKRINFVDVLNHPALKEKKKELKFGEASQLNSMKKSLGRNLELINEQPLVENCYINKKSMEIKEFETTIRYNEEEKNNDIAIDYDENREISKEKLKSNHKIIKSAENFVGFHLNIAKFLRKVFEDIRRNEIRLRNLKIQDATIIGYLLLLKKMELIILFPIKNMIQKGKTNDCLTSEFYNFPGDKKNLLNYLTENYNDSLKNFEDMLKETSELQEKNSYFELEFRLKKNKIFQIKYKEEFENLLQLLKNKTKQDKKEKNCFNKKIMRLLMEIIICKSFEDLFSFFTFDKDETNSDQFYELYEKLKNKDKVEKFIKRSFRN